MPSAAGIAFDPEAVVDLGVVAFAEQPGVLQGCFSVIAPVQKVMDVAPVVGGVAAGEDAVVVAGPLKPQPLMTPFVAVTR